MRSRKKNQLSRFACALFAAHPYPVSVPDFADFFKNLHNTILLKQVEENAKTK